MQEKILIILLNLSKSQWTKKKISSKSMVFNRLDTAKLKKNNFIYVKQWGGEVNP